MLEKIAALEKRVAALEKILPVAGPPGKDGVDGKPGPAGIEGPRGLRGEPGEKGERGERGSDGKNGDDGKINVHIKRLDGSVKKLDGLKGGTVEIDLNKELLKAKGE